jgi:hypothetical protein
MLATLWHLVSQTPRAAVSTKVMVVVALAAASACKSPEPTERRREPVKPVTAALNTNPALSDFVLLASNSVRLQTGSNLAAAGGDVGASGSGAGPSCPLVSSWTFRRVRRFNQQEA